VNTWAAQIEQRIAGMIPPGETVVVGVSGGVDSMVLAHWMAERASRRGWRVVWAHFNHQLRGAASDADERLVCQTAERLGVAFSVGRGDVKAAAARDNLSLEMAARQLRHAFFSQCATQRGSRFVVLAHHADDQVELFFLRLFRGAGSEGMGGMRFCAPLPANPKLQVIRPFLQERKETLLARAREQGIPFSEDATNSSLDILRNRIRHELIPLLLADYQPGLLETVPRWMEIAAAEGDMIRGLAQQWIEAPGAQPFEQLPIALQRQCLRTQLIQLGIEAGFERVEWLRFNPERPLAIAPGATVFRDVQGIARRSSDSPSVQSVELESAVVSRELALSPSGDCQFAGLKITWEMADESGPEFVREAGRERFDAQKVGRKITLRFWRPGDRFQPIGMPGPVKLQDLFVNAKTPSAQRRQRVVAVAENGGIFWVEGLRISECFKLDKTTSKQLKWEWRRSEGV
jgi:tRNA(Ile)-lysidine synthase